ncbi:MAG: histone deacetylase [Flavisolibacter sp.]|nr:histone deacetylase [Flavisolibacter sp.]
MIKYELIPGQLLYEGTVSPAHFFAPTLCQEEIVLLTHSAVYLTKLKEQTLTEREQRKIGFPQSQQLTRRELIITRGTVDCCFHAIENGIALNVAGGTHHAFESHGEGFCLLNDFAVAANFLLFKKMAAKILIIDLDVHQGNGTAKIFKNNDRVFTFSMHGKHNYPFHKEKSDLDVAVEDGIEDAAYLALLEEHLSGILAQNQFDFAFYLSGVDILSTDKFGKLKISLQGCSKRDAVVFSFLRGYNIPCTVAMGGGYSPEINHIVEAHCNTFRIAREIYELD